MFRFQLQFSRRFFFLCAYIFTSERKKWICIGRQELDGIAANRRFRFCSSYQPLWEGVVGNRGGKCYEIPILLLDIYFFPLVFRPNEWKSRYACVEFYIYIYVYIVSRFWSNLFRSSFFFSVIEKNFGARCDLFHHFVGTRREIDNYLATEVARFVKKREAVVKMVASETVKGERERKKKRGRCMLVASCREFDAFLLPERRSVGTRRFPSVKFT